MRCCVRCSPISRSTSSPEVGSYVLSPLLYKRQKIVVLSQTFISL
jgi:hypothetical protein